MSRHLKKRLFHVLLRRACAYPHFMKACYSAFKWLAIRAPLIGSTAKWHMIRPRIINFEIQRGLMLRGKPYEASVLLDMTCTPVNLGGEGKTGRLDSSYAISSAGLHVYGELDKGWRGKVLVAVDGRVLREISVFKEDVYTLKVSSWVLQRFPSRCTMTVELMTQGQAEVIKRASFELCIPNGTGELIKSLEGGTKLNKKGGMDLDPGAVEAKHEKFLKLYAKVEEFFTRSCGKPLFISYGTLLGYVRSGDFIPNDDDFDVSYLSSYSGGKEAKREAEGFMKLLAAGGFNVSVNSIGRPFKVSDGSGVSIDVMPVWISGDWAVGYGGACFRAKREDFEPVKKGVMRNVPVLVPANPEIFLEGYYGSGWKVPNPGYVTDYRQTGKHMRKEFLRFMMTPYEYLALAKEIEALVPDGKPVGSLSATGLSQRLI